MPLASVDGPQLVGHLGSEQVGLAQADEVLDAPAPIDRELLADEDDTMVHVLDEDVARRIADEREELVIRRAAPGEARPALFGPTRDGGLQIGHARRRAFSASSCARDISAPDVSMSLSRGGSVARRSEGVSVIEKTSSSHIPLPAPRVSRVITSNSSSFVKAS